MKSFTFAASCFAALVTQTSAHYIFDQFTYDGTLYPVYQYIRKNTNMNSPVILLNSTDLRCNEGGINGTGTQTLTVQAGHAFSFTADIPVYHDGPLSIYMAKAPGAAADFDGSGQVWFKIFDLGPTFDASGVATWNLYQTYNYTIPPALPSGDYLLRIQQLAVHNPYPAGIPQFYIECAQITVTGGGSGVPGPLVSIPGFMDGTEPGYVVNIYTNFHNYTIPGPAVWSGQSASGTATTLVTSTSTKASTSSTSTKASTSSTSSTKATTSSTSTSSVKTSTTSTTSSKTTSSSSAATTCSVAIYGQCGGAAPYTGCTTCVGSTCTYVNAFYSQCL